MNSSLIDSSVKPTPIQVVGASQYDRWFQRQDGLLQSWLNSTHFDVKAGNYSLLPLDSGEIGSVVLVVGEPESPWEFSALPKALLDGDYALPESVAPPLAFAAAYGWALGCYEYTRYKSEETHFARLVWPAGVDRASVLRQIRATTLVRDLINAPASDLGPEQLAGAAEELAMDYAAKFRVIAGRMLLEENYPAIHAVGQAATPDRAPRLIDLRWGDETAPKITVVGKGVCFDTGGLNLKPGSGMKLMKKDMGGAAAALGLASLIMDAELPVRLRVLIPAVENSVSGASLRPSDVVRSRSGLSIEIGNTDAEGRVILADALCEAASEKPDLLIDLATLTGAARVALGTEVPAFFSNDDVLAGELMAASDSQQDPLWRLPLVEAYRSQIKSKIADLNNAPEGGYGGAITAALFLEAFVEPVCPWVHVDMMAWNTSSKPGRPEGGEAQGIRALFRCLELRYGK